MEFGENMFEIDQAFTDKDLFPQLAGIGGPAAVLGVDTADVRPQDIDGVDWVGLAVKDEIGGVEADREVRHGDIAKHPRHGSRGLLTGLHQEVLTIALADAGHFVNGFNGLGIEWVGRIFRNETAVSLDLCNAKLLREIRDLSERIDSSRAGPRGNQTDRGGAFGEVPFEPPRTNHLYRGDGEIVLCNQIVKLTDNCRREPVNVAVKREETIVEAELSHPAKAFLRSTKGNNQQTEIHRLDRCAWYRQ